MTGFTSDLVGFYYTRQSLNLQSSSSSDNHLRNSRSLAECSVLLYDCYTGLLETRTSTSLESLTRHSEYQRIKLRELRPESGKTRNFNDVITRLLSHRNENISQIEAADGEKCLRRLLERILLSKSVVPFTGFSLLNQAILAIESRNYSEVRNEAWNRIIEVDLFKTTSVYLTSASAPRNGNQSGVEPSESRSSSTSWNPASLRWLDLFNKVFKQLLLNYPSRVETIICQTFQPHTGTTVTSNLQNHISLNEVEERDIPFRITLLEAGEIKSFPEQQNRDQNWYSATPVPSKSCVTSAVGTRDTELETPETELRTGALTPQPITRSIDQTSSPQFCGSISTSDPNGKLRNLLQLQSRMTRALNNLDSNNIEEVQARIGDIYLEVMGTQLEGIELLQILHDIEDKLLVLQKVFDTGLREISYARVPIFELDTIVSNLNEVCQMHGMLKLKPPQLKPGSYGALVVVESSEMREVPPLTFETESGQVELLPSGGANLGNLDLETLVEILRYLDGYEFREHRFTPLKVQITREIALRRQKMNPA